MSRPSKKDEKTVADQSKLFIEKAREIGADEEADVTEVMRRLASQKKPPQTKKSRKG